MFRLKKERLLHIGVVGLGLIGGSMAKALKKYTSHMIYGCDIDPETIQAALADGEIDEEIHDNDVSMCDIVFLALYPRQAAAFVRQNLVEFKPGCIIVDLCGVKRYLVNQLQPLCVENGLCYIGGHPMAGREVWGYFVSDPDLFQGASMILTPMEDTPPEPLELLTNLFADIGFDTVNKTSPEDHDSMIAFTSQLAHVVSSAYIKSPRAMEHHGFSAGSYKDLTRVAKLNPQMWTELFLENGDMLSREIDAIIQHLTEYRRAIADNDVQGLYNLLDEGRKIKEDLDCDNDTDEDIQPLFHLH